MKLLGKSDNLRRLIAKNQKKMALILAVLIVLVGYILFLQTPLTLYLKNFTILLNLNRRVEVAQVDLANAKNYSNALYHLTTTETRWLDMSLAEKPEFSSLLINLTSLTRRAGFTVANIDLAETSSKSVVGNIGKVVVNLSLKGGSYEELKSLIELVESSAMLMDVTSIKFNAQATTYDLTLVVYYYRPS